MRRSIVVLAVCLALAAPQLVPAALGTSYAWCGKFDLPETGIQGDVPAADQVTGRAQRGYNCGVSLVGHSDLGGRGGNANMAWAGNCAYVAGAGNGIAVVDVSDPRHPRHVTTLHGAGSDFTLETIAATKVGDRAVLVAGRYGPGPFPIPGPMDVYDVRDCAHPKYMSTLTFPENVHNFTFSPDGTRVYSTLPLQVADVTDLAHPKFLGKLEDEIPQAGVHPGKYLAHEVWTSPDGNLLYLGGQLETYQTFTIVDVTGWPARRARVLSQVEGRGHSIRTATISGRRYALHSEESIADPLAKGCVPQEANPFGGAAQPWLSDVTDPAHPKMRVSQFRLDINEPENCASQMVSRVNASVHYHDVDDPARTTFAMLSMWNAGLRIVDVRDPLHPREVGYFNPGMYGAQLDQAWAHVRYVASTGQIWFTTMTGGFWVLELEPQVRKALGLRWRPSVNPGGAPPRPAATIGAGTPVTSADAAKYYCTLGVSVRDARRW